MDLFQSVTRRLAAASYIITLAIFMVVSSSARAQLAGTGTIQGLVTDPTGSVIPDATVTLTEEATQVVQTIKSDNSGVYIFPNIKIGTYTVTVAAPGFQTFTKTHNVLEVGSNIAVNVKMPVGRAEQTVTVEAQGLALQTEDVKFKQTVDEKEITELPLNSPSRQITGLLTISGGTNPAPGGDFTGSKYSYQTISVSIAGGAGNTTLWRLDGGDNNDYMANGNLPFPFPDAVNQFSVESTVLGAQEGMHSGGLVNVVTRSGTNQFHGSAFEFIRNNFIDATNFYSTKPDVLHQNQFGGTFGGPIKRDKLFAFAGYQHLINTHQNANTQAHVPTAANLLGDFSVTDPAADATHPVGSKVADPNACNTTYTQLKDPLTGANLPGNKYTATPAWNAQALALMKYLPKPDPAVDIYGCGLVSYAIPARITDNEFVTRVDWTINPKNHFFGRYFIDGYQAPAYFFPTNILVTTASGNIERTQSFTLGEDWTINSTTVNSVHATILRRSNNRGYAPNDINANTLGINVYQLAPNGLQLTEGKFTIGGGTNSVSHFNDNTLAINDDVTMVRGKHQFVFGGEFVRNQLNISNNYESNGTFGFSTSGQFSGNGPGGGNAKGDPSLDFLRGALNTFEQSKTQQNGLRAPIPSLYFQDTFHATKQLTVIAGIRWSPNFMPYDVKNRGNFFDYNAFVAGKHSTVYPTAPAGVFFYGDPGVSRSFTKSTPWQFSPNFGLAYDVTGNGSTVIRAGAELVYDQVNFFTGQRINQNPPYATAIANAETTTSGPLSFSAPWSVGLITTNPFPQAQIPTPATAQFFPGSQYIFLPPQFKPAYTTQWTASVQHQFSHGWQLQLDYIGNKTTHSPIGTALNPAVYVPGVWGANGTGCPGVVTTGPSGKPAGKAGTPCSTPSNTTQRYALTAANPIDGPQFKGGGTGSVLVNDTAWGNYNGLVVTAQHRLSNSFSVLANYTWSKCLNVIDAEGDSTTVRTQSYNNLAMDYGPCGSDYRDVENVVLVVRSDFKTLPKFGRAIVNGWELAPLAHITSGAPFTVTTGTDVSLTSISNDRPNLVPGQPIYIHQALRSGSGAANRGYLNPAAFAPAATGTYGNVSRNSFRGRPSYQFDGQISRIFPIHERLNSTLRLECFNILNHPNFSTPTASTSSSTFGQISSTTGSGARVFQGSIKFNF